MTTSPVVGITEELIDGLKCHPGDTYSVSIKKLSALLIDYADLKQDSVRLEKLAAHMRFFYGRHDAGAWEFPEVVIKSTREQCTADHLRAAIDSMADDNE